MSKEIKNTETEQCTIPVVRRSFSMGTTLDFGKYKGKTIKQLFDEDEDSYLMWVYENFDANFSKDIEKELEWRIAESNDISRSFMRGGDY